MVDGQCSLREAVEAANANTAVDTCIAGGSEDIIILPPGTYTLSLGGSAEDNNQEGDIDVSGTLTVLGTGVDRTDTIIQGGTTSQNGIDHVFHMLNDGTALTIQNLTIRYGYTTSGSSPNINGGGIYVVGGTLHVLNTVFYDNYGGNGGALYISTFITAHFLITGLWEQAVKGGPSAI